MIVHGLMMYACARCRWLNYPVNLCYICYKRQEYFCQGCCDHGTT